MSQKNGSPVVHFACRIASTKYLLTSTNVQILQVEHLRRISSISSSSSEPPPAQSYIAYATHAPHPPQTHSHSPFQLPLLSAPTAVANSHSIDVTNFQQAVLQSSCPTQMRAITAQQLRYSTGLSSYLTGLVPEFTCFTSSCFIGTNEQRVRA